MTAPQKSKGFPIGVTILIIVFVAILFMVGDLTCKRWDAGENEYVLLGLIGMGFVFAILVIIVKVIMKGNTSEE